VAHPHHRGPRRPHLGRSQRPGAPLGADLARRRHPARRRRARGPCPRRRRPRRRRPRPFRGEPMSPVLPPSPKPVRAFLRRSFPHLVFWCWNAVFLSVAAFGIGPLVPAALVAEVFGETRTLSLVAAAVLVIAVPLAATVLGAAVLRRDPARLFRLFYAV